ncbi:hypothetical protein RF55_24747 [Lasius niger]|uniref:Uncharacterized protein n=1 Tax=Lasius niger TaxID=67767 RepID=A0A0J7JUY6_LASNI|nr:hypothetical protein RF55_24747 [Lasius niger]
MSGDKDPQSLGQGIHIEQAVQFERFHQVVGAVSRMKLIMEPQPLLGGRKRPAGHGRYLDDRRQFVLGALSIQRIPDRLCNAPYVGRFKGGAKRECRGKFSANLGHQIGETA